MSREHVFPRWMRALFPDSTEVDYQRVFQAAGKEPRADRRPGVAFDQTVRDFCEECNTGWMHRLEEDARPLLEPLIRNQARTLGPLDQDLLAVWATKTVLTVGPTNLEGLSVAPEDTYRWFGARRRPLPGSLVWLGRYLGEGQWPISFNQHALVIAPADSPPEPGAAPNGLHAVFAIGHLAMCVFVADVPEGPVATGGSGEDRLLIWPTTGGDVRWPPAASFGTDADLARESRRTPDGVARPLPAC